MKCKCTSYRRCGAANHANESALGRIWNVRWESWLRVGSINAPVMQFRQPLLK